MLLHPKVSKRSMNVDNYYTSILFKLGVENKWRRQLFLPQCRAISHSLVLVICTHLTWRYEPPEDEEIVTIHVEKAFKS
jgi:hypothetical protein